MALNYDLHLKGYVGGIDFDRNYVDYILERKQGERVNVLIDSLGGSLATAISIASAFKNHGDVYVHFVGMNASAATIASLGAKHISIDSSAMYLVHKCAAEFFEWGVLNADELAEVVKNCEESIRDLNKLDNNVAAMYSAKCSKPEADLLDLMRVGGWLTAKEAEEWGFVDEVTEFGEYKPVLSDAVASAMAAAGIPIPNMPTENKETLFERFLASIANLFKAREKDVVQIRETPTNICSMNKSFNHIGKALNIEDFNASEDGITLDLQQLETIDNELKALNDERDQLNQTIANMNELPADDTKNVVAEQDNNAQESDYEKYVNAYNEAKSIYNIIRKK